MDRPCDCRLIFLDFVTIFLSMHHELISQAKKLRGQLGLSQCEFAERFGLERQTYAQWERGRRQPDMAAVTLLRIIIDNPHTVHRVVRQSRPRLSFTLPPRSPLPQVAA